MTTSSATDQEILAAALAVIESHDECDQSLWREALEKLLVTRTEDRGKWQRIVNNLFLVRLELCKGLEAVDNFKNKVVFS